MRRVAATVSALAMFALLALQAQSPQGSQPQPPPFRAGVDVVQLDVSVLDKNREPVKGLTAADFTVLENGTPQPIVAFDAVDIPGTLDLAAPWIRDASPDVATNATARRIVVIVFDDAHVPMDPSAIATARRIGREVVDHLGPSDLGAVVFTDWGRHQDVTPDRGRLLAAVDSFVPHPDLLAQPRRTVGRGGPGLPSGELPTIPPCAYRGKRRSIAACVIDTFITAGDALLTAPQGRKTLVYISHGVPFDFSMTDLRGGLPPPGEEMTAIRDVLTSLQAANVNIYAIDPVGVTAEGILGPRMDSLRMFSEDTGGRATINNNAPWDAVSQIFRENSSYYLLGIRSSHPNAGDFVKVQVKVDRPDVDVRTRSGYWGPRPVKTKNARAEAGDAPPVEAALSRGTPGGDLPLVVSVAPFAVARERAATVVVTLGLPEPIQGPSATLELATMALDERCGDCRKLPSLRQTVAASVPSGVESPATATAPVDVLSRLSLPPGDYEIRVAAALGARTGNVFAHVTVPDFRKDRFSGSGLVLSVSRSVTAGQHNQVADLLPLVPTALRDFRPDATVTAFLRLYQGGSKSPDPVRVNASILDAAGKTRFDQTTFLEAAQFGASRSVDYRFDLPIATLASGAHLLTIEAHLGQEVVKRQAIFRIR